MNQPRAGRRLYGLLFEEELERISRTTEALLDEVKRRTPADRSDRRTKAILLMKWDLHCGSFDHLNEASALTPDERD